MVWPPAVQGEHRHGAAVFAAALDVVLGRVEHLSAALRTAAFDVAVAATAMHRFDLDVVLPKLHRALVVGGRLAVWRNAFGTLGSRCGFRERVSAIAAPAPVRRRDLGRGSLRPTTGSVD